MIAYVMRSTQVSEDTTVTATPASERGVPANNFAGEHMKITTKQGSRTSKVDHPAHYNAHPSGVECIDIVEHFNFNVGNAIKYLWREGPKGGSMDDLKKARWLIDREIERRTRGN